MYILYKKVPKNERNLRGIEQVKEDENPFMDGPCLLCVSAQYDNSLAKKSNFGIVKEAMKMMRMRVRNIYNAGFDLDGFPVTFLAIEKDSNGTDRNARSFQLVNQFINKYIAPLISENDQKIDVTQAMKKMRNVNIMTYCDGTLFTQELEDTLLEKMELIGYSSDEAKQIQSQMAILPIATMRLYGDNKSTIFSFKDINDGEIRFSGDDITPEVQRIIEEAPNKEVLFRRKERDYRFCYSGDGAHRLKKYTTDGIALPACVGAAFGYVLENAIENSRSDTLIELKASDIADSMEEYLQLAIDGKSQEEILKVLDSKLSYGGARRMSKEEAKLLDRIDLLSDVQIKVERELISEIEQLDAMNERINATTKAVAKYCTPTNYKRIIGEAGYQWGPKQLKEIAETPSDKEIIEQYQKGKNILIENAVKNAIESGITQDDVKMAPGMRAGTRYDLIDEEIK